jgi:hypothetical protein
LAIYAAHTENQQKKMQMTALVASSLMTLNVSGHISQLEMETLSHEETLTGKISQRKKEESPSKKILTATTLPSPSIGFPLRSALSVSGRARNL